VVLLLAQGLTNRELAERMGVSLNTAGYHIKQVYARLGVNDRSEVAAKLLHLARRAQSAAGPPAHQ
jgi:DNA-binding CsgD family transcriptional regulator